MWVGGYFQRICDQHREFGGGIFDDTEYRKSGHLRIEKCGRRDGTVEAIAHPEMSPVCYKGGHF